MNKVTSINQTLIKVENLTTCYPANFTLFGKKLNPVPIIENISFELAQGESLGIVGESGSGKTTLINTLIRLIKPTTGTIHFKLHNGVIKDIAKLPRKSLKDIRRDIQIIFQDPHSSLNPRMTVRKILSEPLLVNGEKNKKIITDKILKILTKVGIDISSIDNFPHQFSGGQKQRIAIARALIAEPKLILADEPVSALDVSVQAQIINLLKHIQAEYDLSMIIVSHDLAVVKHLCSNVAVMKSGSFVEVNATETLFQTPVHPYTKALLAAIPSLQVSQPEKQAENIN